MTIPEILKALERHTRKFPKEAMVASIREREALTPELLRVVQAVADDPPKYAKDEHYMLHMFALFLLAQFREKRAFPMLVKIISWPGDASDDLLGDTITEGLPSLLASVFDGDLGALIGVALNDAANPFARGSAVEAVAVLYLENQITREQIVTAFRRCYQELKEDGDPQPWNSLVEATADAGLEELLAEMRHAFRKGLVDASPRHLNVLESKMLADRNRVIADFKRRDHLIEDAIAEMSWWAAFDQEERPKMKEMAAFDRVPHAEPRSQTAALPKLNQPPALRYALSSAVHAPTPQSEPLPAANPKVGRNDLCPCGSGKKYKKCCLDKAYRAPAEKGPAVVEPRFMSPVSSYYTQGALMEAMKPGGLVKIHRYALVKLRDDPRLVQTALLTDRAQILQMWRPSKLAAMRTEEIEDKLIRAGAPYNRASFIELTKAHQSAWEIGEQWVPHTHRLSSAEQDFLGLAACELWRRLCPERPSLEMIDDWMCEGYGLRGEKKPVETLAAWWKVWEALRPRISPEMGDLNAAGERIFDRMSQCLSNWCTDFSMEALNSSLNDPRCGEIGVRFIRELLEILPAGREHLNLKGDLASIYYHLDRDEEAERCCNLLIQDHPDRCIGYVTLADGLLHFPRGALRNPAKIQRAIQVLERALAYPVQDAEDFDLPSRLASARESLAEALRARGNTQTP